jgi:hypothetical protein
LLIGIMAMALPQPMALPAFDGLTESLARQCLTPA